MDANPPSDPCEQARKQYTALLLNLASGKLQSSCVVDTSCNAETVEQLTDELADLINAFDRSTCQLAASCAVSVNEFEGID